MKPVNNTTVKKILAPIASLRLTVVLLSLAMVVILAGTTAQEHMGIWQVQETYFHSWFCKIDLDLLFPLVQTRIPGAIPMLGGYTLIALLLVNLLTAHALRFKVSPWDMVLLPAARLPAGDPLGVAEQPGRLAAGAVDRRRRRVHRRACSPSTRNAAA